MMDIYIVIVIIVLVIIFFPYLYHLIEKVLGKNKSDADKE